MLALQAGGQLISEGKKKALGRRVGQQCLEVQHKAFQEHNLPVQEMYKLQPSRISRLLSVKIAAFVTQ